ncbi:helix-turn-helix transcriptional regulator [Kineosporia succinea]|uniref:Transcriptional regulator with XRE-family HTH domain n=1 Tax=Kineosporia succinea TaxID=84632 RepID=A0ABT9PAA5_9ACTN|nr:helix-turn-helix transcriptional regulator [Kineosporia succinea]MDP9829486.1 transcriptional regulator with XRE-family HTH domain [Kineosporia succinea]
MDRSSELGAFLRSRRDRITPSQAGMTAFPGPRRVPGLRKEEVAFLAGLSADYYSRIEQGRQSALSDDICDALARALRLDATEHAHLRELAVPARRRPPRPAPQQPDPGLLRLMANLDHVPTLLLDRFSRVLAWGGPLEAVLGLTLEPGFSFGRWLLLDPAARTRIENWDEFARGAVGTLRHQLGRHTPDLETLALVDDVRADADPRLRRWWDEQTVADQTSLRKRIAHPRAGLLTFGIEAVSTPHDRDQRLIVYTVEPDSATAGMLPMLRSWGTESADAP